MEKKYWSKPMTFDVMAVNEMLSKLEGQHLSYTVFARDTKISRSRYMFEHLLVFKRRVGLCTYNVVIPNFWSMTQGTSN